VGEERALTEKLIGYDTSLPEGIGLAAGFVKGWLESRDIEARQLDVRGLPVTTAEVGPADAPIVLLHGHLDVVPGHPDQFAPRVDGDRLFGRGAYDMKGALAALMLAMAELRDQDAVRVRFGIVPDEEAEEEVDRGGDLLVDEGFIGDFAITGEPTDMHIGVAAKGVLAMRIEVAGRAAHGATPWLGENAILRAIEVFRTIESLPFASRSSDLFDRPSINLGRILGGDALNKVPETCYIDVDVRYLPEQDPQEILDQVKRIADGTVISTFARPPAAVDEDLVYVRALCEAASRHHASGVTSVGRDGASDAVSFLRAGVPAVEFGPVGAGHHGPEEWVSISSLTSYRHAIVDFVTSLPEWLPRESTDADDRATP
jgi:succinyl-diaminopimelate desuccinylase